ncbi:MAG: hypothetical protein NC489_08095 [Ruminococcus flavefaciens]|nr:hypothetical protein [Ruminococcus flavefaciens]
MFSDPTYYNAQTLSLRESLIPMAKFMETVKKLEEVPGERLFLQCPEKDDSTQEAYVVPYPYKNSAYSTIIDIKRRNNDSSDRLSEDDREAWVGMIKRRVGRILQNRIHESNIYVLDDNYDVGIILNKIDGHITPFLYSELKGVDVVTLDIRAQSYILRRCAYTFNGNIEEYNALRQYFTMYPSGYSAWINLRYKTINGDYWHYDNDQIYLSLDVPYDKKDFKTIQEYIGVSILAHKKVITIT